MEEMKLGISFEVAQALESAIRLTRAIKEQAEAFRELDTASVSAEQSSRSFSTGAEAASGALKDAAPAAERTAEGFEHVGDAAAASGIHITQLNQTLNRTTVNIKNVENSTRDAGNQASASAGQVQAWIDRYLGMAAVYGVLEMLKTKLEEVQQAEAKLAGDRSTAMTDNVPVARMLARFGHDDAQAEALVEDVSKRSGSTREQARAGILAAGQFGDPAKKRSAAEAEAIVASQAASMYGLGPEDLESLVKLDKQSGGTGGASLQRLLASLAAAMPAGQDPARAIKGAITNVLPDVQQGEDPHEAIALYGALVSKLGPSQAQMAVKQIRNLAEGGTGQRDKFFAANGGVGFTRTTDAEAAQLADITGPATALENAKSQLALDERELEARRQAKPTSRNPEERAKQIESQKEAIDREETRIGEEKNRIAAEELEMLKKIQKARSEEDARRQVQAYNSLDVGSRLSSIIAAAHAAQSDPEAKKALNEALGPRGADALAALASDNTLPQVRGQVWSARPADFNQQVQQFDAMQSHVDQMYKTSNENRMVASTSAGDAYLKRAVEAAKTVRTMKLSGTGGYGEKEGHFSEAQLTNFALAYQMLNDLNAAAAAGNVSQDDYDALSGQLVDLASGVGLWNDALGGDRNKLDMVGKSIGDKTSQGKAANPATHIVTVDPPLSQKQVPGSAPVNTAKQVQLHPSGSPADSVSYGGGGDVHHHTIYRNTYVNISNGNVFPGDMGYDWDSLPSAGEQMLG